MKIMTLRNSSSHPSEALNTINPEVIQMVQEMYNEKATEVLARLEKMDTRVRKVIVAALE